MPPPPWMVSSTMTPIVGIGLEGLLDRVDVAERHAHGVVGQLELAAIELAVGDRQHALGLAVEGVLGIDDLAAASGRRRARQP